MFKRWSHHAALAVALGIGSPALVLAVDSNGAAATGTGGTAAAATSQSHAVAHASNSKDRQIALPDPMRALQRTINVQAEALRRQRRKRFAHLPGGVSRATLEAIAQCESGGDPRAVSAGGTYRGKYQFDYGTWASVGGHGDPAKASEREQDYRAALLYERAGSSPWPVCG